MQHLQPFTDFSKEEILYYHGSNALIPFRRMNGSRDGSGTSSGGIGRFGGFFFTSEKENAEFYGEFLVAVVRISEVEPHEGTHSSTVLKQAITDDKNYLLQDVYDGSMYSDVVVVPHDRTHTVEILRWDFVNEYHFYAKCLKKELGKYVKSQYKLDSFMRMVGLDLDYALEFGPFSRFYNSLPA